MSLKFNIQYYPTVSVVSFTGKIMTENDCLNLNEEIGQLISDIKTQWVFDFDQLTHINSSGINFIIRSLTKTRVNNGDLALCAIKGNVKTLFEIAKLTEIFTIYDTVEDAINHFKK